MGKFIDLMGKHFGRLTVIKEAGRDKWNRAKWLCKCNCGNEIVVFSINLRSNHTQSCGCLKIEKQIERNKNNNFGYKHGLSYTKGYINAKNQKRNAMKLNQTPDDANLDIIQFYYIVADTMADMHVDHIQPLSKGGLHHQDNLQILSAQLNLEKYNKWPLTEEEQKKYRGYRL